jgi:hypothetical protein
MLVFISVFQNRIKLCLGFEILNALMIMNMFYLLNFTE